MSDGVDFQFVDPQSNDALSSMRSYFDELNERFTDGFDPGNTLDDDADSFRAPQGRFVLLTVDGGVAGCGGVHLIEPNIAEVKRMWIHPDHRGKGLGAKMLTHLERVGELLDADTVRLDTNSVLAEAIAMYTSRGYVDIPAYNDNPYARRWFERTLT